MLGRGRHGCPADRLEGAIRLITPALGLTHKALNEGKLVLSRWRCTGDALETHLLLTGRGRAEQQPMLVGLSDTLAQGLLSPAEHI
jgi:hypothetical protein